MYLRKLNNTLHPNFSHENYKKKNTLLINIVVFYIVRAYSLLSVPETEELGTFSDMKVLTVKRFIRIYV